MYGVILNNEDIVLGKKIYLAGPMRGYEYFNFPAFHKKAKELRAAGAVVFSPAENDEKVYGKDFGEKFKTGDQNQANNAGFNLRKALADDLEFICKEADGVYLLKGWEESKGALAEKATAIALGLELFYEQ